MMLRGIVYAEGSLYAHIWGCTNTRQNQHRREVDRTFLHTARWIGFWHSLTEPSVSKSCASGRYSRCATFEWTGWHLGHGHRQIEGNAVEMDDCGCCSWLFLRPMTMRPKALSKFSSCYPKEVATLSSMTSSDSSTQPSLNWLWSLQHSQLLSDAPRGSIFSL